MSESEKDPTGAGEKPAPEGKGAEEPEGAGDEQASSASDEAPAGKAAPAEEAAPGEEAAPAEEAAPGEGGAKAAESDAADRAAGEAALAALEAEIAADEKEAAEEADGEAAAAPAAADPGPVGPSALARFFGFFRIGLRQAPGFLASKLIGLLCLCFVVLVWYWATAAAIPEERIISPSVLPSPYEVVTGFDSLMDRGLIAGIAATLKRVFIGFGLAIAIGVSSGVLAASYRPLQAFLAPLVLFGRSLPLAALIPLTLVWFGIEDKQKIMFIFIATVPFIFSDTVAAVLAIHERYVETGQTLGASKRQIIFKVLVPLSLPDVFTSVRFLFGLSFGYIMLAEVINAKAGIGYLINQSFSRGAKMDHAILLLIIVGLLAYVIDRLLVFFQRGLFPYRSDL